MGQCLWCGGTYFPQIRWTSFFNVDNRRGFCGRCTSKFEFLGGGEICRKCGRDLEKLSPAYVAGDLCTDCVEWGSSDILTMNRSLLTYNEFLREVVTRFKFRGDAILADGFYDAWRALYLKHFKKCIPVPVPLSAERMGERHFNQAWILASLLPVPPEELLVRVRHDAKQSKKSRQERLLGEDNPFALVENISGDFRGKSFVIIDDIYTTGTTIRYAAHALFTLEPAAVYSMTLAR